VRGKWKKWITLGGDEEGKRGDPSFDRGKRPAASLFNKKKKREMLPSFYPEKGGEKVGPADPTSRGEDRRDHPFKQREREKNPSPRKN